jgi:RNA polymerase sigma-70 factor (ECF subfamily)
LLPRQQDTEDVMQNTLVVLWKKFDDFDPATSFYSWACRVAYFEAKNYRRQNGRLVTILDEGVFEQIVVDADDRYEVLESRRKMINGCVEKLHSRDRELIGLRYLPGATVKDIAQRLGRPANSVCKSLARIRQALWDCINDELALKDANSLQRPPKMPLEDT